MARRLPEEWRVPVVFVLLSAGGLLYDAAQPWFWQRTHDTAPVAAGLLLLLLILLLLRRRFAWWMFVVFWGLGLSTWVAHVSGYGISADWVVGGLVAVVELGLLVSPSMRRFMRFHGWLAPSPS